ncbi:hypothetical protein E1301_Tti019606 [Triplophysa tibetana]|uniref:Immunoglobulin V-set domain-containing protein n=1 Tax=Triplophysa tibetana TaxID=1572043 RepID=A0A5A9PHY5_9TELE|nr:hypothetical protein E1301_Tti019606 [Triplophysa tibetana]
MSSRTRARRKDGDGDENIVPELYHKTKAQVMKLMSRAHRVAITCGSWTSVAKESYVTMTAHYINEDWRIVSHVLQTRAIYESHTDTVLIGEHGKSINIPCAPNKSPQQGVSLQGVYLIRKKLNEKEHQKLFYYFNDGTFTIKINISASINKDAFPNIIATLKNLTVADTGIYWCTFNFEEKETYSTATFLLVKVFPQFCTNALQQSLLCFYGNSVTALAVAASSLLRLKHDTGIDSDRMMIGCVRFISNIPVPNRTKISKNVTKSKKGSSTCQRAGDGQDPSNVPAEIAKQVMEDFPNIPVSIPISSRENMMYQLRRTGYRVF